MTTPPQTTSGATPSPIGGLAARIAGLPILKGLVLYGATLTFAGFYTYFIAKIAGAPAGTPPEFDTAMVAAAAALAGVLGSAFALYIGVPTPEEAINNELQEELERSKGKHWYRNRDRFLANIRIVLSLDPGGTNRASWPLTAGIWTYALVAAAVAIVYFLNQEETPAEIKALALAFGGYVVGLLTTAYGIRNST